MSLALESRTTSRLHRCKSGVALEQETFSRLPGLPPKGLLAPSPVKLGEVQEFQGLCQAIRVARGDFCTTVSKLITDRDFFWEELTSDYRYRIALPEGLIPITETDLWEFQQKISHYRYRFSLKFQIISITDTDFGLKTNEVCNHFGGRRRQSLSKIGVLQRVLAKVFFLLFSFIETSVGTLASTPRSTPIPL